MTSGFFAVLDDIVILMDDVLTMTKVSAKKTAGILADDLAVNAEKSSGFSNSNLSKTIPNLMISARILVIITLRLQPIILKRLFNVLQTQFPT